MLHKEIPFLRIGLPFCAGIISGLYFEPGFIFLVIATIVSVCGFSASLFYRGYKGNIIFGNTITLALFVCGILLYTNEKKSLSSFKPGQTTFKCFVSDYPEEKENSYRLIVKLASIITSSANQPVKGSMMVYFRKDTLFPSLLPGDQLIIRCTPVEITNKGNPYEFDYRFWSENQGIKYYSFAGSKNIISHTEPPHRKIVYTALIIREKIIDMYRQRGITGKRLALVAAMTLGQKNMLDPEQKQNFIRAGVMHVMAVSGLHSVILSMFVFNLFFFLKRRFNVMRIIITITILWAFAFVTGLTPSVLRATLMFTFLQAGDLMKRRVNSINSVLASAFVLALIKPTVIFDAGFLLSYAAVIFIISFYRDLYVKLRFGGWLPDKIWQSASVTLVAQAGTLPLTIMLFNRFPTYFMLTNIIIVPLSSLLIITGCILPVTFPVWFVSKLLALFLNFQTGLTEMLTERASGLPLASIENIGMPTIECCLLSIVIFVACCYLLRKRPFPLLFLLATICLFSISSTFTELSQRASNEIIVYNSSGSFEIGVRTGTTLNVWTDTTIAGPEVLRHAATMRLKLKIRYVNNKTMCLKAGANKIMIGSRLDESVFRKFAPGFIILTGKRPIIDKNISFSKFTGSIIISEASPGFRLSVIPDSAMMFKVHNVRRSGAYKEYI